MKAATSYFAIEKYPSILIIQKVFWTSKILETEIAWNCRSFFCFYWEWNLLFSRTTGCIPFIRVSIDSFQPIKCYFVTKQCIYFLVMETRWAKVANKWTLVWFVLILKHIFLQSGNCQDFFSQGLNQQFRFCIRLSSTQIFFLILSVKIW